MKIIKLTIILGLFGFFLGCSNSASTPGGGDDSHLQKTVEQLEQEVLDLAGRCSNDLRSEYEKQIQTAKANAQNNDNKLKNNLNRMKRALQVGSC